MLHVCFVCLGNICRSPTAEGIFCDLVAKQGLQARYRIDSAGTGGWHVGASPDPRSRQEAKKHGIMLPSKARQFHADDFRDFDHIIAMDRTNLRDMLKLCPESDLSTKAKLLRDFDPKNENRAPLDVPDPYYGKVDGFSHVFEICRRSCQTLLETLESHRGAKTAPFA